MKENHDLYHNVFCTSYMKCYSYINMYLFAFV